MKCCQYAGVYYYDFMMNNFIWSAVIAGLDLCWLYNFADVILDALHFYANHRANSSKFTFIWRPGVPGLRTWKLKHFMEMTNIEFENDYFKINLKMIDSGVFLSEKTRCVCVMTWLFSLFFWIFWDNTMSAGDGRRGARRVNCPGNECQ